MHHKMGSGKACIINKQALLPFIGYEKLDIALTFSASRFSHNRPPSHKISNIITLTGAHIRASKFQHRSGAGNSGGIARRRALSKSRYRLAWANLSSSWYVPRIYSLHRHFARPPCESLSIWNNDSSRTLEISMPRGRYDVNSSRRRDLMLATPALKQDNAACRRAEIIQAISYQCASCSSASQAWHGRPMIFSHAKRRMASIMNISSWWSTQ